jgi:hypothetical protein
MVPTQHYGGRVDILVEKAQTMWQLFESSGCIIYYLLYKMMVTQ